MLLKKSLLWIVCYAIFLGLFFPIEVAAQGKKVFRLAIFNLEAVEISESEAKILTNKLSFNISTLIKNPEFEKNHGITYELIERAEINKILDEFEFSRCVTDTCAVEFGKILSADRVIIGSVGLIGKTYNVAIRLIDVETSKQLSIANIDYKGEIDEVLSTVMQKIVEDLFSIENTTLSKLVEEKKEIVKKPNSSTIKKNR